MSAFALISGVLHKDPTTRTNGAGHEYVAAIVKFQQKNRQGETESLLVSVTAFFEEARRAFAHLRAGDAVSVGGQLQVGIWERDGVTHPSLSMLADSVASAKPKPKSPKPRASQRSTDGMGKPYSSGQEKEEDFNDPISI